jgi:hypothetical protein
VGIKQREEIRYRLLHEKAAVKLSEQYASTKNYLEASKWYASAQVHRSIREALKKK